MKNKGRSREKQEGENEGEQIRRAFSLSLFFRTSYFVPRTSTEEANSSLLQMPE
jgi:hypothetical protein